MNALLDDIPRRIIDAQREWEEGAVIDFFGSKERAEKMGGLFPGRYRVEHQRSTPVSFMDPSMKRRLVIRDLWTKRAERYEFRLNLVIADE